MSHTDNHTTRHAGRRFAHRLTRRADRHNARALIVAGKYSDLPTRDNFARVNAVPRCHFCQTPGFWCCC